jgi:hypothetical protein
MRNDMAINFAEFMNQRAMGTIEFWAPEVRPDGQPNITVMAGSKFTFVYDPVSHIALFGAKGANTALTISFAPGKSHFVAVTWKDGAPELLFVDGKMASGSKAGH